MPFLGNVTRGRGIPAERLAEVGQHYLLFGGKSPINDQCRRLLAALTNELRRRGIQQPLYWGNRNWDPYLDDELRAIERDGHRRVLAVVTSAYPSYSSCRQYRENLFDAAQGTQVHIDRIRHYANHPGFVDASVDASLKALDALGERADEARLVFVTHSIPIAMAETAGPAPRSQSRRLRRLACGRRVRGDRIRSASSAAEATRAILPTAHDPVPPASHGWSPTSTIICATSPRVAYAAVVVVPIGFVSDHMEVVFDLDTEAAATADECGLAFARAATAGDHPAFVSGLVDLMVERAAAARGEEPDRLTVGAATVGWYECRADCCPNLREPGRPTMCEAAG